MELTLSDYDCIGQVAKHCDWSQLCIANVRALNFDVLPLLCDYSIWLMIFENKDNEDWVYKTLWEGGTYEGCNGKIKHTLGLKAMWVFFAYAHYIVESSTKDTPSGRKTLDPEFTIPVSIKDLTVIENKYRSMAFQVWEGLKDYMCHLKLLDNCDGCGCTDDCDGKTKNISGIRATAVYFKR